MQLPIGYDNFAEVIDKCLDFVDKTLFIKEVIDHVAIKVHVITRPRRFGKTLNLSMLHYFLASEAYGRKTRGLFDNLKIAAHGESYMRHQGQYPVIFMTFKDVREHNFSAAYANLTNLLHRLYREYGYLLKSDALTHAEKETFSAILEQRATIQNTQSALLDLTYYLFKHHKQKVWLLIDEYDTPIQSAYLNGYYSELIDFIRGMFSAALKTNPYLEKSVLTGIVRIAKESLFSGLNHVEVCTLLDERYSEYFGFTEAEVQTLLQQAKLKEHSATIQHWYNGYRCGNTIIYNPWSIANCLNQKGNLCAYWVNTSGNDLIGELLARSDESLKNDLKRLLRNQSIESMVDEYTVFGNLEKDNDAIWNLLLWSGYLKAVDITRVDTKYKVKLIPPNNEVYMLYRSIIQSWFDKSMGYSKYQSFLKSLIQGEVEQFTYSLKECLQDTFSIFDITGKHPEKFYHGFVLGLMVSLSETHDIQSNRESGYGRYDAILIPKDRTQLGVVLEFKTVQDAHLSLENAAEKALEQIITRNYAQQLRHIGIQRILHLGLAFYHKNVAVAAIQPE